MVALADETQAHVVVVERTELALDRPAKQVQQQPDFRTRTLPVLTGEGEDRQHPDTGLAGALDDRPGRARARPMTGGARQTTRVRPAAVAVHDDGHMFGNSHGSDVRVMAQTVMISCSLSWSRLSMRATC